MKNIFVHFDELIEPLFIVKLVTNKIAKIEIKKVALKLSTFARSETAFMYNTKYLKREKIKI